jgi:pimeloyl-ACP methyl ester carboxylesterase
MALIRLLLLLKAIKNLFLGHYQVAWKWPINALRSDWDSFEVIGPRETKLSALFGHSRGKPRGLLVFVHPLTKSAKGFWLTHGHAEFYRRIGFHVVLFDFNGFGESDSRGFNFSGDLIAVGHHMKAIYPRLDIGLIGASFGAGWAVYALARRNHPFSAAILEGAFAHIPEKLQKNTSFRILRGITWPIWPLVERNHFPVGYAKRMKHFPSILLLHAETDRLIPVHHSRRLADAMANRANVKVHHVDNANHNMIFVDRPEEYASRVLPFLNSVFGEIPD